ncbi:MAG: hypothetical protein PVH95_06710 [Anaerolineae bacterium]|jgi:hypothetical protein
MVHALRAGHGAKVSCDKLLGQRNANTLQLNATPISTNIMRGDYPKLEDLHMLQGESLSTTREHVAGWIGIGLMALLYAGLYASNLWFPLSHGNYTMRIWNWSQLALAATALLALVLRRSFVKPRTLLIGLALGVLSGLSHSLKDPSVWSNALEGGIVWIGFMGGVALFQDLEASRVVAFQPPVVRTGRSLLIGIAAGIPLAVINNLFFYLTTGPVDFRGIFSSAFEALNPAISEEIIFRFFVLALCLNLLEGSHSPRLALTAAVILAVVPHSLNHLPDLFLENASMGLTMLVATSLLFGLPMALLQIKRNLETAIAFHWVIDFMRFLFGF